MEEAPPALTFVLGERDAHCVELRGRGPAFLASLDRYVLSGGALQSLLRVNVVGDASPPKEGLPPMLGRCDRLEDGIRFVPAFPFDERSLYRASFHSQPNSCPGDSAALSIEFALPRNGSTEPTHVIGVFPSADDLPENLLRFYVAFSAPMQRGHARSEIVILGPDGAPLPDLLYRAPVELWGRDMQRLTVLLDPGRLKRGVGPHRALGPPLKAGEVYTLVIGAGMLDRQGRPLPCAVSKRFRATAAVREIIDIDQWQIATPSAGSLQHLVVSFPRSLDHGLLSHALRVVSPTGHAIAGRVLVGRHEGHWTFTPALPWAMGIYHLQIHADLEDVCGNTALAPFDGPLRTGEHARPAARQPRRSFSVSATAEVRA